MARHLDFEAKRFIKVLPIIMQCWVPHNATNLFCFRVQQSVSPKPHDKHYFQPKLSIAATSTLFNSENGNHFDIKTIFVSQFHSWPVGPAVNFYLKKQMRWNCSSNYCLGFTEQQPFEWDSGTLVFNVRKVSPKQLARPYVYWYERMTRNILILFVG